MPGAPHDTTQDANNRIEASHRRTRIRERQIVTKPLGIDRFAAELAHAVGVMVPVFTSYLGHKHWSFRE